MLWFALHLPRLSLEAAAAALPPEARGVPMALLADHRIVAVDAAAAAAGVQPGQRRATALALQPDLRLLQASPARDAEARRAVAHAALAYTPMVTLHGADAVLLEVQASLRLFGGAARLAQRLRRALTPLGLTVRPAAAPTALGALLLARWRDDLLHGPHQADLAALQELLDAVPIGLLDAAAGPDMQAACTAMGLATLGDLRRLPREGVARRFGGPLLDTLDRARGDRPDPRRRIELPPVYDGRLELPMRADHAEQVLHGAAVLLGRLVAWAQAQHGRIAACTLQMRHDRPSGHGPEVPDHTALDLTLAEPSCDAAHLQGLLRERLAHVRLAAPTLELRLACRHLVQQAPPNGELFPSRVSEREGLTRLIERLRARLGDDRVQQPVAVADHRPERATAWRPYDPAAGRGAGRAAVSAVPRALALHRPVWLWPEPVPLPERQLRPWLDGAPLVLLSGPERIETGWWDGPPATRDYYIAQAGDGTLVWAYRGRLPPVEEGDQGEGWFLQGRFG